MNYYLGVDIGGTSIKLGIVSDTGEIFNPKSYDIKTYEIPILNTCISSIKDYLKFNTYKIQGIGVSATGQIDTVNGEVIGTAGHLPNYIGSKISYNFKKEFNLETSVVNDANCMILGELWKGNHNSKNIVGITIGTGVGGGIIVNNEILLGNNGIAGEIGHITIHGNDNVCSCNNTGCYEKYASTTALVNKAKKLYKNIDINGKWIFDNVKNDPKLKEILDIWIDDIVSGLVSLIHIFNPSLILIGGGVSSQQKLLINPIKEKIKKRVMPRFYDNLKIKACTLKNNAGLIGAVYYFINQKDV